MRFDNFKFETSFGVPEQLEASDMPEVAFAGRSNVGKSSLLNKLFNRKGLARVSSEPGKTATINFYLGDGVRLVDLPGYGYAKVSRDEKKRWSELMEHYFNSDRDIRLVVVLTDMRRSPTQDDMDMLRFLVHNGLRCAVVMTKSDKLNKTQYAQRVREITTELSEFPEVSAIPFSALNGDGTQTLRDFISETLEKIDS